MHYRGNNKSIAIRNHSLHYIDNAHDYACKFPFILLCKGAVYNVSKNKLDRFAHS